VQSPTKPNLTLKFVRCLRFHVGMVPVTFGLPFTFATHVQIGSLQARKLTGLTDFAALQLELSKASQVKTTSTASLSGRLEISRAQLVDSQRRADRLKVVCPARKFAPCSPHVFRLQNEIQQLQAAIAGKASQEARLAGLQAQLRASEEAVMKASTPSADSVSLSEFQAKQSLEQVFAGLQSAFASCSTPSMTVEAVLGLVK
jgi:hypothetical protein